MGKSQGGAVWLNAEMLSPYDFWQFWRNTTDADVGRFLKLYTELPVDECDRLGALGGSEINAAKIRLANEVTALCHGAEAAAAAEATARAVFEQGGVGEALEMVTLSGSRPRRRHRQRAASSFAPASSDRARRPSGSIAEKGLRFNNDAGLRPQRSSSPRELVADGLKVSIGKKRHALVARHGLSWPRQRGRTDSSGCSFTSRASMPS